MTHEQTLTKRPVFTESVNKRMLVGAGIALALITFFLVAAGKGNPAWGSYWRVKPLLLTPFLGAIVGLCFDITEPLRRIESWAGRAFWVLSFLGYAIGLWMSLVLGMAGTLWN